MYSWWLAYLSILSAAAGNSETVHAAVRADGAAVTAEACEDLDESCQMWAEKGECAKNPGFMMVSCRSSCYLCQSATCLDHDEQCTAWAAAGECAQNEHYMLASCAFACRTCFLNTTAACRRESSTRPAAVPGTIDATFESLIEGPLAPKVLHREPWVISFERFLSDDEADRIVSASGHNFEQSRFLGDEKVTGEMPRTSTTSWCNVPSCLGDATFQLVRQRISDTLGVPWANSEHLQLLRYQEGQYYREHHDQISPPDSAWGPRLYTFFMYLSDVEEGGETRFTKLNLTVAPRKGSAILWPSVVSSDPLKTDERTSHEALPVTRGLKYAANFWVHMYDFQGPHGSGCDNRNYLQHSTLQRLPHAHDTSAPVG